MLLMVHLDVPMSAAHTLPQKRALKRPSMQMVAKALHHIVAHPGLLRCPAVPLKGPHMSSPHDSCGELVAIPTYLSNLEAIHLTRAMGSD